MEVKSKWLFFSKGLAETLDLQHSNPQATHTVLSALGDKSSGS